jgi:hypothetical protein
MRTRATYRVQFAATALFITIALTILIGASVPNAAAVTRPLQSAVCVDTMTVPTDYRFAQLSVPYWAVVGVAPEPTDDKDIYLYTGPNRTGSLLAQSVAVAGADFIVGDFNHTPYGTYYPSVTYGSNSTEYTVEWKPGGKILPLNQTLNIQVSGWGSDCFAFDVWDVYLEAGATYRFFIHYADFTVRLALFRNPGTGAYWAGRDQAAFQLSGAGTDGDFVAPASDWYGLVVGLAYRQPASAFAGIEVRKLNTCQPLTTRICQSAVPYSTVTGPVDSYYLQQNASWWSAVAVAPSPGDSKSVDLRSQCDYTTSVPGILATSNPGIDQTALVVADFNHSSLPLTLYATIDDGDVYAPYTIEWEDGADTFPMNGGVSGSVGGTAGTCNLVEIWDLPLNGGSTYRVNFNESGTADIHVALFGHADTAPYYAGLQQALWHHPTPFQMTGYAPLYTDYYGLAVFANERDNAGSYAVSFEELNDCDDIASNTCLVSQGNLKDFHIGASTNDYWVAVGVLPADADDKDISVFSSCDGGVPLLGYSNGTQGMDFVVADCNHPPVSASSEDVQEPQEPAANNWYPRVTYGSSYAEYTVASDLGNTISEDLFPHDVVVPGTVGGLSGSCGMLKVWDVYLVQGLTYTFGFTRGGDADVRVALFRNTTNNRAWLGRAGRQWELTQSQNFDFTAPATDYYGLVVFANRRGKTGTYTLRTSRASGVTGIDPEPFVPDRYALYQNAPNPFNPTTEIRYDVPSAGGHVQLRVYDVHGRLVRTLVDSEQSGGAKSLVWDARDDGGSLVATGVYFYRLDAPGFSETRKTVVMK